VGDPCGVYGIMYFDHKQGLFYKDHGICYYQAFEIPEDDTIDESEPVYRPHSFHNFSMKKDEYLKILKKMLSIKLTNSKRRMYLYLTNKSSTSKSIDGGTNC